MIDTDDQVIVLDSGHRECMGTMGTIRFSNNDSTRKIVWKHVSRYLPFLCWYIPRVCQANKKIRPKKEAPRKSIDRRGRGRERNVGEGCLTLAWEGGYWDQQGTVAWRGMDNKRSARRMGVQGMCIRDGEQKGVKAGKERNRCVSSTYPKSGKRVK